MNSQKYTFITASAGILTAIFGGVANGATAPTNIINNASDVVTLFCGALLWMFWGLLVLSVAMFLIGGYGYATSSGDAEKVRKATKTLTYAAIALVVAFVAGGVPSFLGSFFSVSQNIQACP